jgi:hypothetical protein
MAAYVCGRSFRRGSHCWRPSREAAWIIAVDPPSSILVPVVLQRLPMLIDCPCDGQIASRQAAT